MYNILVDLHAVGGLHQCAERQAQFVLRRGDFVVMLVAGQAHVEHRADHFATDIDQAIDRRDREIAALGARTMAQVAGFIRAVGVGRQFDIVDAKAVAVIAVVELHIVEHEEFGFGSDIDGVADTGRFQIGLGALGRRTRVA